MELRATEPTGEPRAPRPDELDALIDHDERAELPWLGACWIETDEHGRDRLRWSTRKGDHPACARTHLLAGRRAISR